VIGFLYNDLSATKFRLCGSDEFCAGSSLVAVRANHAGKRVIPDPPVWRLGMWLSFYLVTILS